MRFGHFDDKNREYVITTPKTPYPWINYLGSENFYALLSHRAGGYCLNRDARRRRLMSYRYNNVPIDVDGRYFPYQQLTERGNNDVGSGFNDEGGWFLRTDDFFGKVIGSKEIEDTQIFIGPHGPRRTRASSATTSDRSRK